MTVAYDCYAFQPRNFAAEIAQYVESLQDNPNGYSQLRTAALEQFECNANVGRLASEYGCWDRKSLAELTDHTPVDWLILFLYGHFSNIDGAQMRTWHGSTVSHMVRSLGWDEVDCRSLVNGKRSFADFAGQYLHKTTSEFWSDFHPQCTLGQLGWFSVSDMQYLLSKLYNVDSANRSAHLTQLTDILATAILATAVQKDLCLCIIQSA
jgi:hypothetical protein